MAITLLDEHGDASVGGANSRLFGLIGVPFPTEDDERHYLDTFADFRGRIPHRGEFHYTHTAERHRRAFLSAVAGCRFGYAVCLLDKDTFPPRSLDKPTILAAVATGLAAELLTVYRRQELLKPAGAGLNERIVYDECNDKLQVAAIRTAFLSLPSGRSGKLVRSIKPGRSSSDPRLQLADMICGAVADMLDGNPTNYRLIRHREYAIRVVRGNEGGAGDSKPPTPPDSGHSAQPG